MNKVKIEKRTSGPVPYVIGGIGALCISAMAGPIGLLSFPLLVAVGKKSQSQELDAIGEDGAYMQAQAVHRYRYSGEKSIEITKTIGSGGIINLPMKRTWRFTFEDKERS